MIALINKFKTYEVIRYFKDNDSLIWYLVNTKIYNNKDLLGITAYTTYFNRYGMLEINSDEEIYKASREQLIQA